MVEMQGLVLTSVMTKFTRDQGRHQWWSHHGTKLHPSAGDLKDKSCSKKKCQQGNRN